MSEILHEHHSRPYIGEAECIDKRITNLEKASGMEKQFKIMDCNAG